MILPPNINILYLLIGSNMGDRMTNFKLAISLIETYLGKLIITSAVYQTAAWGMAEQDDFLNQVVVIETALPAPDCMNKILFIEQEMGRIRTKKNAPRIIDIDILFCNSEVIKTPSLIIPHPEIEKRRFVLVPLNEISPTLIHPILKKSIHTLLAICCDPLQVSIWSES